MQRDSRQYYYVYLLASRSRVLYIGVTGNLVRRIWEHQQGRGSEFTRRYKVNRLVWYEAYADSAAAIAHEKKLKGLIRAKKIALIELENPAWQDLSEGWNESFDCMQETS
jgi:putative endonuclease